MVAIWAVLRVGLRDPPYSKLSDRSEVPRKALWSLSAVMLISRIGSPPSNVSLSSGNSQDPTVGDRGASLSHLWWVLEGEIAGVAESNAFVESLECGVLDISEREWMPSILNIRNDGFLELRLRNINEPFAILKLRESAMVGRVGKSIVQLSNSTQTFLISCEPADFGRLCATLHAWTRLRAAGLPAKLWSPPLTSLSDPEAEILKCEIEAHFTAYKPDMMKWAPFLARLKRSGVFELFNLNDERIFTLQTKNIPDCSVRHVDPSLVGSELVILLLPDMGGPDSVYIRFAELSDFEDWFTTLKALSQHSIATPLSRDPLRSVRFYRKLHIGISSCQTTPEFSDSLKNTYIDLCLNHWISSRTCVSSDSASANWGQWFEFVDPEPSNAQARLQGKALASCPLELKLRRLTSDVASEHDPVLGTLLIEDFDSNENFRRHDFAPGLDISVSAVETYVPVLDASYYSEMQKYVENMALRLPSRLVTGCPCSAMKICNLFTDIYRAQGRQTEWILALIDEEVPKIDTKSATVFRGTSPLSRALEAHLQLEGSAVLQRTVGRFIRKLLAGGNTSLELDPARIEKSADLERNQVAIGHYLSYLWSLIQAEGVPPTFKVIFKHLRRRLVETQAWPDEEINKQVNRVLSAFVFLRFYSPALLNPQHFGLTDRILEPHQRRTTILIAKLLQGFANGVKFGTKESWLIPMNTFIDDHEAEILRWYAGITDEEHAETVNPRSHLAHRRTESEVTPLGDRVPKELPFEPFMKNQLSNPSLVDEWASYAALAESVVALSDAGDRFHDALQTDPVVKEFYDVCAQVMSQRQEILDQLREADTMDSNKGRFTADLTFNKKTMLFGTNAELLEPELSTAPSPSTIRTSPSMSSRLGWFMKDSKVTETNVDPGSKPLKRKWTNVLRRRNT